MIAARQADLSLPEYAAFNHGRDYPRMRRWELPFALFSARLADTMSVFDCTINPLDFGARLAQLYPHVLYRHHNPVGRAGFVPPVGVPDEAFDRVVSINTLEHLLADQRETLVAELARKLKAGGLLILTSDFYFDSMWGSAALVKSGLIRRDGREVFNGLNRIAPAELTLLCARHDLFPLDDIGRAAPREGDPALYLQGPPYNHASIAGVFRKGASVALKDVAARRVFLMLLTWNMRAISVESLRALAREARMLARLGHDPFVLVCDNGSTDGTREALLAVQPEIDVPHDFLFNRENRGISRARNQLIDYLLEAGGDYALFVDGDIELVPFSSFAMLRHMESAGRVLGALGAYSHDTTNERRHATPYLFNVEPPKVETLSEVVTTGYGLLRREVFEAGVRFDASGPFEGPGWGFEDNDLAFQLTVKGFAVRRFRGMRFLHRDVRSSIPLLRREGHDPAAAFRRRKQHLIDKWSGVPLINDGPLAEIRRAELPNNP